MCRISEPTETPLTQSPRHMLIALPIDIRKLCLEQLGAEKYIDFTQEKDIPAKVKEITTYGAHGSIVFAATKASYALGPNVVSISWRINDR